MGHSLHLLTLTTALGGYMRQVIGPLNQALTHGKRQVVSTVYEEVQAFWNRVDGWSAPDEQRLAGPMTDLAELLVRDGDAVEVVRKNRAEAMLGFLRLRPSVRGRVTDSFGAQIRKWRAIERSTLVQRVLDQALAIT